MKMRPQNFSNMAGTLCEVKRMPLEVVIRLKLSNSLLDKCIEKSQFHA